MSFLRELGEHLKGLQQMLQETKQDLGELFTDGATELIIKNNNDWQPSSQIEDDANRVIDAASTRYRKGIRSLNRARAKAVSTVEDLGQRKVDIQQGLVTEFVRLASKDGLAFVFAKLPQQAVFGVLEVDSLEVMQKRALGYSDLAKRGLSRLVLGNIGVNYLGVIGRPTSQTSSFVDVLLPRPRPLSELRQMSFDPTRINRAKAYQAEAESFAKTVEVCLAAMAETKLTLKVISRRAGEVRMALDLLTQRLEHVLAAISQKPPTEAADLLKHAQLIVSAINAISEMSLVNEQGYPDDLTMHRFAAIKDTLRALSDAH